MKITVNKIQKHYLNFEDVDLSDENTVRQLILHRSKVDSSLLITSSFDVNQELSALYHSLDEAVLKCSFKEKQLILLEMIYKGNTIQDICYMKIGYKKSATYEMFNRMIIKIIKMDNYTYHKHLKINPISY